MVVLTDEEYSAAVRRVVHQSDKWPRDREEFAALRDDVLALADHGAAATAELRREQTRRQATEIALRAAEDRVEDAQALLMQKGRP